MASVPAPFRNRTSSSSPFAPSPSERKPLPPWERPGEGCAAIFRPAPPPWFTCAVADEAGRSVEPTARPFLKGFCYQSSSITGASSYRQPFYPQNPISPFRFPFLQLFYLPIIFPSNAKGNKSRIERLVQGFGDTRWRSGWRTAGEPELAIWRKGRKWIRSGEVYSRSSFH